MDHDHPDVEDEVVAGPPATAAEDPQTIFCGEVMPTLRNEKQEGAARLVELAPIAVTAPAPDVDPLLNKLIDGQFRLLRKIGAGGHGAVYEAQDVGLSRRVAVKVMLSGRARNPEYVQKFIREARTLALLAHPNVTRLHRTGRDADADAHYLAMEYVEGRTLQEILCEGEPLSLETAIDYTVQTCQGLAAAHEFGIIHRDVKPGNLIVTPDDVVKITDFGLAKVYEPDATMSSVIGTPHFMPPEQFSGDASDGRTDIYALGVTLYVMLSLEQPHRGTGPAQILLSMMSRSPTSLLEHRPDLPESVWKIVARMIHRNRDKRYADCVEIARDLGAISRACPQCAAEEPLGSRFCGDCGADMTSA